MNIFALDEDPKIAAFMHIDVHCVKMATEYAQLLSTAHRMLDGKYKETRHPVTNKIRKFMLLPGETIELVRGPKGTQYDIVNPLCYRQSHMTHPCGIWARISSENYMWLYELYVASLNEHARRYNKEGHGAGKIKNFLSQLPANIKHGARTEFGLAMPEQYKVDDPVQSYKNYYLGEKVPFATWTNTPVPDWFLEGVSKEYDASHFTRTR